MPYKLTYFDLRGLAEPARYMFANMGQDYEDVRLKREQFTPDFKKNNTKWGKLPMLEVDGEIYSDSVAISRYLGSKAGLVGTTPLENLKIDEIAGVIHDFLGEMRKFMIAPNDEEKGKVKKNLQDEIFPFYMDRFEKTIKENGGYIANGKLSWIDLYFVAWSENLGLIAAPGFLEKYPHFQALKAKVQSIPGIKAWLAKRPQTHM